MPLVLKATNDGCALESFLHVSERNELFYFTKQGTGRDKSQELIVMNILDNKACVNDIGLEHLTSNIDKPPILLEIVIKDPDTSFLLKSIFNRFMN